MMPVHVMQLVIKMLITAVDPVLTLFDNPLITVFVVGLEKKVVLLSCNLIVLLHHFVPFFGLIMSNFLF